MKYNRVNTSAIEVGGESLNEPRFASPSVTNRTQVCPRLSPEENLFFLPCLTSGNQILVAVAKYSTVIQIQKCLIYLQGANRNKQGEIGNFHTNSSQDVLVVMKLDGETSVCNFHSFFFPFSHLSDSSVR